MRLEIADLNWPVSNIFRGVGQHGRTPNIAKPALRERRYDANVTVRRNELFRSAIGKVGSVSEL